MDRHRLLKISVRQMVEGTDGDDAGVVDEHVDAAEGVDAFVDGALSLRRRRQVGRHGYSRDAAALEISFCPGELLLVAGGNHHARTQAAELAREQQPQAAGTASD